VRTGPLRTTRRALAVLTIGRGLLHLGMRLPAGLPSPADDFGEMPQNRIADNVRTVTSLYLGR